MTDLNKTPDSSTALAREAAETPKAARYQIERNESAFITLGERLRKTPPRFIVTSARGSSDHAATYGRFRTRPFARLRS